VAFIFPPLIFLPDLVVAGIKLRAARKESGERSGVSPPVSRFCTGKQTPAARQFYYS